MGLQKLIESTCYARRMQPASFAEKIAISWPYMTPCHFLGTTYYTLIQYALTNNTCKQDSKFIMDKLEVVGDDLRNSSDDGGVNRGQG